MPRPFKTTALTLALLACTGAAQAAVNTYTGSDDGAPTSGPWTQSAAAEAQFQAAAIAFGSLQTLTFEGQNLGMGGFTEGAATVSFSGSNFGPDFSGVSNANWGNLYGFNVTANGSQWAGAPQGGITFSFSGGTHAFGGYFTGLQTSFSGTTQMVITFDDGQTQTLNVPVNVNGGASYFGFTNTNTFQSVTLSNVSSDAWGVDNITFATAAAVPEPASLALMLAGLAAVGGTRRRLCRKQA
ncbi:PEP-CTERM sorting domain-containing protein [Ideonella livida]|uniref:PEP-CTERM sorting domain-containing protein n=1 Tax=Ideonella livida TaxID=2707176 RepID=A0A7C9TN50_9BURK|nr:PEP-CTERM sorting domain-containing protein [Ideonella livida]NDY93145.1 PEP-CTERM sorting domain-containing protein [Ideonella livida]